MVTKTLSIKDTHAQHTANHLKNLVENFLEDYGMYRASNMLNMVDKMNADPNEEQENSEVICEEYSMNLLDEISEEVSMSFQINHMRCAVHTHVRLGM